MSRGIVVVRVPLRLSKPSFGSIWCLISGCIVLAAQGRKTEEKKKNLTLSQHQRSSTLLVKFKILFWFLCNFKMIENSIQGFKTLPIKFSSESSSAHTVYFKEHSVRQHDDSKPAGKTLFLLNVPPYATKRSLRNAFTDIGQIEDVLLQKSVSSDEDKLSNGFQVAYIVFKKREALVKALKLTSLKPLSTPVHTIKTGISKWMEEYNSSICNRKQLMDEVNKYMQDYDKLEKQNQDKKEELDDDGWTVVTKKGRNPGISRKESVELKLNEKIKQNSNKKELKNFYTFQIRESKMKNLANLRKNFEEAKKKVSAMRTARRFRPY